jgi:hypothetical protein
VRDDNVRLPVADSSDYVAPGLNRRHQFRRRGFRATSYSSMPNRRRDSSASLRRRCWSDPLAFAGCPLSPPVIERNLPGIRLWPTSPRFPRLQPAIVGMRPDHHDAKTLIVFRHI